MSFITFHTTGIRRRGILTRRFGISPTTNRYTSPRCIGQRMTIFIPRRLRPRVQGNDLNRLIPDLPLMFFLFIPEGEFVRPQRIVLSYNSIFFYKLANI